jgi:NTE family protein
MIGLVLTGGGARAAYQVGALQAIAEVCGGGNPFKVLTGVSAGAINCAALASFADDLAAGVHELRSTWDALMPEQVFCTDPLALLSRGTRWLAQLGGGRFSGQHLNALLDTRPLRALLTERLPMSRIPGHLASRRLHGLAVTATSYRTGSAISFYDGAPQIEPWVRSARLGTRTSVTIDHVLASAAIPIFFPPVSIEGTDFGDGCVRLGAPLSPAIHLGAERILAIGVRYARSALETTMLNQPVGPWHAQLAEIGGVLLNAVFLDSLDSDVERLQRINTTLSLLSPEQRARHPQSLRPVPALVLRPSRDLGRMAIEQYDRLPAPLRHLLVGIGASGDRGWDLVSYLAFEPVYIRSLIELGYADTRDRAVEIKRFLDEGAQA